jgi:hypothetical protein
MLTRRLVWVAEDDGKIHGVLVAFAAHGYFYPVRLVGHRGGSWAWGLLRRAFSDALGRGQLYYITHVDLDETGTKLARILRRRGGAVGPGAWIGGFIPALMRKPVEQTEAQVG